MGVVLPVVVRTDEPQYWYVDASVQGLRQCPQPKLTPPCLSENHKVLLSCTSIQINLEVWHITQGCAHAILPIVKCKCQLGAL